MLARGAKRAHADPIRGQTDDSRLVTALEFRLALQRFVREVDERAVDARRTAFEVDVSVTEREGFGDPQLTQPEDDVDGKLRLASVRVAHTLSDLLSEGAAEHQHLLYGERDGWSLLRRTNGLERIERTR